MSTNAGPEMLLSRSSDLGSNDVKPHRLLEGDFLDAVEAHEWKCVHTVNGIFFSLFSVVVVGGCVSHNISWTILLEE